MPSLKSWQGIITKCKFQAKPKSMQDHLKTVIENRKSQVASQEKQPETGGWGSRNPRINWQHNMWQKKNCEDILNEKAEETKATDEAEKAKAKDTRKKAMETIGQTNKRKGGDETTPPRKPRRSGNNTFAFIADRSEERKRLHEEEVKLRREELKERRKSSGNSQNAMLEMMRNMQQQQQQPRLFAAPIDELKK